MSCCLPRPSRNTKNHASLPAAKPQGSWHRNPAPDNRTATKMPPRKDPCSCAGNRCIPAGRRRSAHGNRGLPRRWNLPPQCGEGWHLICSGSLLPQGLRGRRNTLRNRLHSRLCPYVPPRSPESPCPESCPGLLRGIAGPTGRRAGAASRGREHRHMTM